MNKRDVKQLYYLSREVAMWQEKLNELRESVKVSAPAADSGGIRSAGVSDKVGNLAVDIADTERIIAGKYAEIQLRRNEVLRWISSLEDSTARQVVMYRCVDLMSWADVAAKVGGGNSEDSVRMIFNRLFTKEGEEK